MINFPLIKFIIGFKKLVLINCIFLRILDVNEALIKLIESKVNKFENLKILDQFSEEIIKKLDNLKSELKEAFDGAGKFWKGTNDQLWSFGPKKARCNVLVNRIPGYRLRPSVWDRARCSGDERLRNYDHGVVSGFQMRCRVGPLCEEPLRGVAFFVEEWSEETDDQLIIKEAFGPLSGQIIAAAKEGCKLAFQLQPQRLVAAMYSCVIQATTDVLGKVYAVLSKRGGRVSKKIITVSI